MRFHALTVAALAVAIAISPCAALASCRVKTVAKRVEEVKLVVPFAVPVGVPVAPFAPYFYGYQQHRLAADETSAPVESQVRARRESPAIATHCAACHGGADPKASLSLDRLDELTTLDRLRAIRAVAAGRMPKGTRLSADELRAVIEELSATPTNASKQ